MSEKILFVDDEPNVLEGIKRQLRKRYDVATAAGGDEGLSALETDGPFAVVVSDMKMPGMNGAQFLTHVREREPDAVRMILSGQAELESTITAINQGNIFRFLTKPCDTDSLAVALEAGLTQYRLVIAERQLLEDTLSGTVKLLTEVMALVNPEAFSRATRIQRYAQLIAGHLGLGDSWEIRLASMLSQLGCLTVPDEILRKALTALPMTDEERKMYDGHPQIAGQLLEKIPRLEAVAEMVSKHMVTPDSTALTGEASTWDFSLAGGQVLRAAAELDRLISSGATRGEAYATLRDEAILPTPILQAVAKVKIEDDGEKTLSACVADLRNGMVMDQDLKSAAGVLLVAKGQEVSETMILRLTNYRGRNGVEEPFRVRIPAAEVEEAA